MTIRRLVGITMFLLLMLLANLNVLSSSVPDERIKIFVSILPQAFFVEQIGREYVRVEVLVAPGQSPHTYEPTPKQMSALAESSLYFRIGVPFEKQLSGKIEKTFKNLKIIDTHEGVKLRDIEDSGHEDHDGGKDPHIWLSPRKVKIQAANICRALVAYDSVHAQYYRDNLETFQKQLDEINREISRKLAPFKGGRFYAFHPSYGYFSDDYGLIQQAVEIEGKEPSAKQLAELIDRAKVEGVKVIFVQPQFAVKTANTIAAAIGGRVVPLDPLAKDFFNSLNLMADELVRAFSGEDKK